MPPKSKRDMKAFHEEALDDIHGRKPLPEVKPKKARKKKKAKTQVKYEKFDGQQLLIMGFQKQEIMRLRREHVDPEKLVSSLKEKATGKNQVAILTPGHISVISTLNLLKRAPQLGSVKEVQDRLSKGLIDMGYATIKKISDVISRDYTEMHDLADRIGYSYYLASKPKPGPAKKPYGPELEPKKLDIDEDNLKNKMTKTDLMNEVKQNVQAKKHNKPISGILKDGSVIKLNQKQVAEKLDIQGRNANDTRKLVAKAFIDGTKVAGGILFAWGTKVGTTFNKQLQNHLITPEKEIPVKIPKREPSKQAEEESNDGETIEVNLAKFLDENNDDDEYDDSF